MYSLPRQTRMEVVRLIRKLRTSSDTPVWNHANAAALIIGGDQHAMATLVTDASYAHRWHFMAIVLRDLMANECVTQIFHGIPPQVTPSIVLVMMYILDKAVV